MALSGLMNADPARAMPLIKQMLESDSSSRQGPRSRAVRPRAERLARGATGAGGNRTIGRESRPAGARDSEPRAVRWPRKPPVADRNLLDQPEHAGAQGRAGRLDAVRRPRRARRSRAQGNLAGAASRSHQSARRVGRPRRALADVPAGEGRRGEARHHQRPVRRRRPRAAQSTRDEGTGSGNFAATRSRSSDSPGRKARRRSRRSTRPTRIRKSSARC